MNTPNKITIGRIIFVPVLMFPDHAAAMTMPLISRTGRSRFT